MDVDREVLGPEVEDVTCLGAVVGDGVEVIAGDGDGLREARRPEAHDGRGKISTLEDRLIDHGLGEGGPRGVSAGSAHT